MASSEAIKAMPALWRFAESKSLRECHRAPNPNVKAVNVDTAGAVNGLCNSRSRLSPLAAVGLFLQESLALTAYVLAWVKADRRHDVGMLTLTVPHYRRDKLEWLLESYQLAWQKLVNGGNQSAWKRICRQYGIVGWRWQLELTVSRQNGFHPHRHIILFFNRRLSAAEAQAAERAIWQLWNERVYKVMGRRPHEEYGVDLRLASRKGSKGLAAYVTKGMALEATGGINKAGKGSRSIHEVLLDLATAPKARDLAIFHEIEEAVRGARWHGESQQLKELMRDAGAEEIRAELEEQHAAEHGGGTERYVLAAIDREEWKNKLARNVERRAAMRTAVREADTLEEKAAALEELLESWGVEYETVMVPATQYEAPLVVSAVTSITAAAEAHAVISPGALPRPGGSVSIAA